MPKSLQCFNMADLRKLIKYEERMGVNTQQNDYYEGLFRRTTASYRAKIDRENGKDASAKIRSSNTNPARGRQSAAENRKILSERNNGETSTSSYDLLSSNRYSKGPGDKKEKEPIIDKASIKVLIEKTLTQVLQNKYSEVFVENDQRKEMSPIQSIVEQVLKEKLNDLRHPFKYRDNFSCSDSVSFISLIEGIVTQVIQEKCLNLQNGSENPENLRQHFQQKLTISNDQDQGLPREPVKRYDNSRPLDTESLVQHLLSDDNTENRKNRNKNLKKSTVEKENCKTLTKTGGIKRLQRSPRKKPEWQDPSLHDNVLDKPLKVKRPQSPAVSSSARSGRSSSVLILRSKSQGRKPSSDPVALYQYYKNEWEHFRNQIPGETSHGRLRWHVRQRLLDPE